MIWFTSDLHLGHDKVIGFCNRPYKDVAEMDLFLIKNICAHVKPEDTLYILGDFSFHRYRDIAGIQLPGNKILVRGNHDKYSDTQYRALGFNAVIEEGKICIQGRYFILSHYPYWPKDTVGMDNHDLRYEQRRPVDRGSWLLCGHVHEKWKCRERMINVGVDQWGFKPVSEGQIIKCIESRKSQLEEGPCLRE